ncbi:hypothetical protein F5X68DRAFT_45891 [Plectosphaerella plurivora]|uniref:C6 transcription factor n=1 Tax=Plectosphaerella plurivora TaxID=936078 RepID=A0A9P9ADV5_9PEZI|nr:hypothetical protein F5X68DRAFT_45891 [Plectosphaerella plurivora]
MVSTRSASRALDAPSDTLTPPPEPKAMIATAKTPRRMRATAAAPSSGFTHDPTTITLAWLAISLPLVAWDTGYVLGRPHTMPGGDYHWPLWSPYKLYGEIDGVYGFKAFHARDGFTGAQSALNVIETVMYGIYLYICLRRGRVHDPAGTTSTTNPPRVAVTGRAGAIALLVGFSAAVMTLSKTVLYWLKEYYSGFDNIGHNTAFDLILLWIIPNGAWLVGSTYMIISMGKEIVDGLAPPSLNKKED